MKQNFKLAIEEYQCSGCVCGGDIQCFQPNTIGGVGCGKHVIGTLITGIGHILLGLPNGFNRVGKHNDLKPVIFETYESSDWKFDKFNVAIWKHYTSNGNTIVRGIMPRRNEPFIHIFLEDCRDKIDCIEISAQEISEMD
jgi:hypothetical protein